MLSRRFQRSCLRCSHCGKICSSSEGNREKARPHSEQWVGTSRGFSTSLIIRSDIGLSRAFYRTSIAKAGGRTAVAYVRSARSASRRHQRQLFRESPTSPCGELFG